MTNKFKQYLDLNEVYVDNKDIINHAKIVNKMLGKEEITDDIPALRIGDETTYHLIFSWVKPLRLQGFVISDDETNPEEFCDVENNSSPISQSQWIIDRSKEYTNSIPIENNNLITSIVDDLNRIENLGQETLEIDLNEDKVFETYIRKVKK